MKVNEINNNHFKSSSCELYKIEVQLLFEQLSAPNKKEKFWSETSNFFLGSGKEISQRAMRKNCINFFQTTDGVFEIFWGCPSPCSASGLSCWVVTSENIKTKKRIFFSFGIMTRLLLSSSNAIQIHANYSIKVSERKQT